MPETNDFKIALSKARSIKLLVLDVDGVLTDGKLYFSHEGEWMKSFSISDGLGIKLLAEGGIQTAIITGRTSNIVKKRCSELGIQHIIQGREDKLSALKELLAQLSFSENDTAYIGDDLPDLSAIRFANFGITVPNGSEFLKSHADWITEQTGGNGAVREAAEFILQAQDKLETILKKFY